MVVKNNPIIAMKKSYWHVRDFINNKKKKSIEKRNLEKKIREAKGLCFYRCDSNNIGDKYSGPNIYFSNLQYYTPIDIFKLKKRMNFKKKPVIIGGGGLLHEKFFKRQLEFIVSSNSGPLVAWGIGFNSDIGTPQWKPDFLDSFSFVGLRDHESQYDWVPCSSCLHSAFDMDYPILHPIVLYNHWEFPIDFPFSIPELRNDNSSFKDVIKFLSSGETVVTTSFHGAYWATLLGRKVVVVSPFSKKFYTLRHSPSIVSLKELPQGINKAQSYPHALEECRSANLKFADKVFSHLALRE